MLCCAVTINWVVLDYTFCNLYTYRTVRCGLAGWEGPQLATPAHSSRFDERPILTFLCQFSFNMLNDQSPITCEETWRDCKLRQTDRHSEKGFETCTYGIGRAVTLNSRLICRSSGSRISRTTVADGQTTPALQVHNKLNSKNDMRVCLVRRGERWTLCTEFTETC